MHLRQNAGHMEDFCVEVGQVGHYEYEDGLDDSHLVGVTRDQTRQQPPEDANKGSAESYDEE